LNLERVKQLLDKSEGIRLEFKKSRTKLSTTFYESVCAMLNRDGGDIILGADDDGNVTGIDEEKVESIKTNLVNLSNNSQKLDPPFILFPQLYDHEDGIIMHVQVPSSSQLHKTAGKIYDRSNDGDFEVTDPQQIAQIYNNKRNYYTEGIIYPEVNFNDFRTDLFEKARNLIKSNQANHPWLALSDEEMLKKANLWRKDYQSGLEGYTLAAILIFGKDEVIHQILPHYKIDALLRIENTDRYDDRLYVTTNLINAYDQLMDFIAKHLPDKFYTVDGQRKSLRTDIFREVIANLLVHREFTNAFPAKLLIENDQLRTENANNPHGSGSLALNNFTPFPKNPSIAKFFIQLGRVDELGSGIINVNKFIKEYSGKENPEFIEGEVFKMNIPIPKFKGSEEIAKSTIDEVIADILADEFKEVSKAVGKRWISIIRYIYELGGIKAVELQKKLNKSERTIMDDLGKLSDFVTYKGSKKTGEYKLHHDIEKLITDKTAG
jgi:ATP-dependent DNA helicase RecG